MLPHQQPVGAGLRQGLLARLPGKGPRRELGGFANHKIIDLHKLSPGHTLVMLTQ